MYSREQLNEAHHQGMLDYEKILENLIEKMVERGLAEHTKLGFKKLLDLGQEVFEMEFDYE